METSLRLRLFDGPATVRFLPRLTSEEYAELMVRVVDATTRNELQAGVERLAAKWNKECQFDGTPD